MKKKLLSVILITVITFSGCGNRAEEGTADSVAVTENTENTSAKAEETKSAVTPDAADASKSTEVSGTISPETTEKPATASNTGEASKATATPAATEKPVTASNTAGTSKATTAPEADEKSDTSDKNTSSDKSGTQSGNNSSNGSGATTGTPTPAAQHTSHTWNGGSVTKEATCSSEGERTYTCTVCGETKTESISRTSHNYVTETKAATCTEAGSTKTYCTICGDVKSESSSGSPAGHSFEKVYWPNEPSCDNPAAYYNLICTVCGANGGDGTDPALDHTPVSRELCHGDCVNDTVIEITCSVCGAYLGREAHNEPDDHDWVEGTYEEFDPETHSVVTKTSIYCSRCGVIQ